MTRKQIEAAKNALYDKYYDGVRFVGNLKQPWTKEDRIYEEELSCREMINAILIYHESCDKDSTPYKENLLPYTKKVGFHEGLISEERLQQLIAEQKYDISQAEIGYSGEDSEGVSYNYCHFADER